jgi:hypothetical protein
VVQEQRPPEEGAVTQAAEDESAVEAAVEERRLWLHGHLVRAAEQFGLELLGDEVSTYDMRSVGSQAHDEHDVVWLRVVLDDPDYQPACRWEGNVEAAAIHGVPKPQILAWADWNDDGPYRGGGVRLRGEVMTFVTATAVAANGILTDDPELPESWWRDLGNALAALAAYPVPAEDPVGIVDYTINSTHYHFDVKLDAEKVAGGLEWTTAHGDLHWGNITRPELVILDWETWRRAPAGYDVATLLCNSVLHPPTAQRLRAQFAAVLESPTGQFSLLSAAGRYLWLAEDGGEFAPLEPLLRQIGLAALDRIPQ